jgi:methionyl-tRNA formyltransferase
MSSNLLHANKILFVGNRCSVYEVLRSADVRPRWLFAKPESLLESELRRRGETFHALPAKSDFLKILSESDWDLLISNGFPYILPVSQLQTGGGILVNTHPSLLPYLRGRSPINGAIFFGAKLELHVI